MMITGKTRVFAIIADPIGHVRTPQALNALFAREGLDAVIVPTEVAPADLAQVLNAARSLRNFGGFVVTVPHKTAAANLCDLLSDRARIAGAVNVIRRETDGSLAGDLLDGEGFAAGLDRDGIAIFGRPVFLAGAGGAASAIAFALAARGIAHLTIANRSADKAAALAAALGRHHPNLSIAIQGDPGGHDLAINATSLGLKPGDPLPFDPAALDPGTLVAEVIMQPEITPLLAVAIARGLSTQSGQRMLDGQLAEIRYFLLPNAPSPCREHA